MRLGQLLVNPLDQSWLKAGLLPCARPLQAPVVTRAPFSLLETAGDEAQSAQMFLDRRAAGLALAKHLRQYSGRKDVIVLGLPRGGVPVAYEVALALNALLDVLVVRKLGLPSQPELAMGAIASGDAIYINQELMRLVQVRQEQFDEVLAHEKTELRRRELLYREGKPPLKLRDRMVIVVDDGMATGATMLAAVHALRTLAPAQLIVAVPVASVDSTQILGKLVDQFVCVESPRDFRGVGQFYREFGQTSDAEVRALLSQAGDAT